MKTDIRTYAVVILNEECGFLEWVPNTMGYRNIVIGLYEQRGMHIQVCVGGLKCRNQISLHLGEIYCRLGPI
jgi:phosphatidylinositol kinase/protein kinase (PI-3  family)